ncbi:uncharacterized protein LOC119149839 [Falco rusticolus]|uniref:uncharacterized protein LOC114016699 n=1 Tax=Falco cherrug TaxID=345164 RepID=UPI0018867EFB|nr:uncharacterized protein LOC114016699 [Falco cherrug]XP_037247545.1 uncharacterized protein LOC119149839 [Falco rusticolus]
MDYCVYFNYMGKDDLKTIQWLDATIPAYRNASAWCNYTSPNISKSSNQSLKLPAGLFRICGDRAWPGIPSHAKGVPCSIGRLTLLTPNTSMIITHKLRRQERATHAFQTDCKNNLEFWSSSKIIAASILAPGIGTVKVLNILNKLGCWLAKQTNTTSLAPSGLLLDVDSIRHATLQNRATIDFLLLAQGHCCQDFDGLCCMNMSDHSESIHKSIENLQEGVQKLEQSDGFNIFGNLFGRLDLTAWIKSSLQIGVGCLFIFICFLICIPRVLKCVQTLTDRALIQAFFIYKEGGDVGISRTSSTASVNKNQPWEKDIVMVVGRKLWEQEV